MSTGNRSYLAKFDLSAKRDWSSYISADGSLLTLLSADEWTFAGTYAMKGKFRKLGLYCAEQFCPDYRRLQQEKSKTMKASVEK